jgi:ACS family tartrate transporter-like MFS transporter
VTGIGNIGGFIGPYAVGLLKDSVGSTTGAFAGMGVLALGAAMLILLVGRQPMFAAHRQAMVA